MQKSSFAAIDLLAQSGETLAGRISLAELTPLDVTEVGGDRLDQLWVRGGFPDSFLAGADEHSLRWRRDFIRTYLERDIPSSAHAFQPRPCGGFGRCWPTSRAVSSTWRSSPAGSGSAAPRSGTTST